MNLSDTQIPEQLMASVGLDPNDDRAKTEIVKIAQSIDLNDHVGIGRYGAIASKPDDVGHEHNEALEGITSRIGSLVTTLEAADPRIIMKRKSRFGFLDRFRGTDAVTKLEYVQGTRQVDKQLSEVPASIQRIETSIARLESAAMAMDEDQFYLRCHFVAGQWYLSENPDAGSENQSMYGLDSARERLQKRLQQIMLVITSNETGIHQLKLMRANSMNLLDRLHEITYVLVPTWRTQRISIYAGDQDFEAIKHASEAHEALVTSLRDIQ